MDEYDVPKPVPARPEPTYPGQPSYQPYPGQPGYQPFPGQAGQAGQADYPNYPGQATYPGAVTYPGQPYYPPQPSYPPGAFPGQASPTGLGGPPTVAGARHRPSAPARDDRPGPRGQRSGGRSSAPASRGRAVLTGLLTTLGCLAGSLAVAAFVIATIVINPERPGAIVKAALSTPAGRSIAINAITSTLRTADPTLTNAQASADATAIVASPTLASSLGSSKGDVSAALLTQLKQIDPAAAAAISAHVPAGSSASPLSALPTQALSTANRAHNLLRTIALYLLIIGVICIALALLFGPRRDRVLVRVGYWALAASVVQLIIWLGLPKLFGHFTNPFAQIAAAALRAGGASLLTVFIILAVSGAIAVTIGLIGRTAGRLAT